MNYSKLYNDLIQSRRELNRQKGQGLYLENHHIVPRCMEGTDDSSNLVLLTAKEHFIAHKLLTKIHPENIKILWAFSAMIKNAKAVRMLTARQFEECRLLAARLFQEKAYNEEGYHFNSKVGRFTAEQKQEIIDVFKGTTLEKEIIASMYGVHWSTIMKVLYEAGMSAKEIKTIACKKREYRHKLQLLQNNAKRNCNNKGIARNKKALEQQRESIKQYWQDVRDGKIQRVEKNSVAKPIRVIETNEIIKSRNFATQTYFVQNVSHKLVHRITGEVFHWEYV